MKTVHLAAAVLAACVTMCALPAAADPLGAAYQRILANPADTAANLDYALIAEGRHEYRLALSAYERVLLNDPNNVAAKRGLVRVRRIIQPPSTQFLAEAGTMWEFEPRAGSQRGDRRLRALRPSAGEGRAADRRPPLALDRRPLRRVPQRPPRPELRLCRAPRPGR